MHRTPDETPAAPQGLLLVERVLGNRHDAAWSTRLERVTVDHLRLDQWQAQKNRFRKTTESGLEIAVSLDRASHLHDGDVLVWDEAAGRVVVASITLNDVLVVRLARRPGQQPITAQQIRQRESTDPARGVGQEFSTSKASVHKSKTSPAGEPNVRSPGFNRG